MAGTTWFLTSSKISALILLALCSANSHAQPIQNAADFPGSKALDVRSYGFAIPQAEVTLPKELRVRTLDDQGKAVVAKVHCKVGDNFVVLLPDGQLVDRLANDATITEDKFVPIKAKDLGKKLTTGPLEGFKFRASRHYVFIYNTSEPFFNVTRSVLETMFQGVKKHAERQDIDVHNPEVPLVVIMFNKESQFQNYRRMPQGVLAYYNQVNNHVVLHEDSRFAGVRNDLARAQLISTVAHEGAHQILHNIGVQQRLSVWPMWLSEGLAEYFAPTSFGKNYKWQGAGNLNNLRMFELERYMQSRSFKKLDGQTLSENISALNLDSRGYATSWSITHFLAKQKTDEFDELVKFLSGLPPLRGMRARSGQPVQENLDHFSKFFGDDYESLEKELMEHLNRQSRYKSPVANQAHVVVTALVPTEDKPTKHAAMFHTRQMAEKWKQDLSETLTSSQQLRTRFNSRTFQNRAQAANAVKSFLR